MTDLAQSLQGRDFGHLKIIAGLWRLGFDAPDFKSGVQWLVPLLAEVDNLRLVLEALPENARLAIWFIVSNDGRVSWSLFSRRFGELREMGSAQRDRVKPYLDDQASTTEMLWYRAIIGRAFFETPAGLQEFAYIPEEIMAALVENRTIYRSFDPGRRATPTEKAFVILTGDKILDDAATFLSGVRAGFEAEMIQPHLICGENSTFPLITRSLKALLEAAGLLDAEDLPNPEKTRQFLEMDRSEALLKLFKAWFNSRDFNELWLLPVFTCEGEWRNDPLTTRQTITRILDALACRSDCARPAGQNPFWSLNSFVAAVKEFNPDFQRSAGDYESWFITRQRDEKVLRGYEFWDDVEGELIRYLIGGPLFWLGFFDLGFPVKPGPDERLAFSSFRFSEYAQDLREFKPPQSTSKEDKKLIVKSEGVIVAPRLLARSARYQIARFCDWEGFSRGDYTYRLSTASLHRALRQNLQVQHLLSLLNRYSNALPANIVETLKRWEEQGNEARISKEIVLRVKRPEIIQALKSSPANRFLGEQLGPVSIIVHPGAHQKIANMLISMGYLADIEIDAHEQSMPSANMFGDKKRPE